MVVRGLSAKEEPVCARVVDNMRVTHVAIIFGMPSTIVLYYGRFEERLRSFRKVLGTRVNWHYVVECRLVKF